jgi:hypothetical protein
MYTYALGGKYDGEWKDGSHHGRGVETFKNGDKYDGEWKDGSHHGHGVETFKNGDKYDGEWKDGSHHGRGVKTFKNGDKYDGEWKDGNHHGRGVKTFKNGDKYDGKWKGGVIHGRGMHTPAGGAGGKKLEASQPLLVAKDVEKLRVRVLRKMLKERGLACKGCTDKKEFTKMLLENQDVNVAVKKHKVPTAVGGWGWWGCTPPSGCRDGRGMYTYALGGKYDGEWKGGMIHGRGVKTFKNGGKYDGEWKDGSHHGRGVKTFKNGDKYDGEWEGGSKHGIGVFTPAGGAPRGGQWVSGKEAGGNAAAADAEAARLAEVAAQKEEAETAAAAKAAKAAEEAAAAKAVGEDVAATKAKAKAEAAAEAKAAVPTARPPSNEPPPPPLPEWFPSGGALHSLLTYSITIIATILATRYVSGATSGGGGGGAAAAAAPPAAAPAAGDLMKFIVPGKSIIVGSLADATAGIGSLLGVSDEQLAQYTLESVAAIEREFMTRGTAADKNNYAKVLAGTFDDGKTISALMQHKSTKVAKLQRHHIIALRLYTTSSYSSINGPMRKTPPMRPHPFTATTHFINEGIKKLRHVEAKTDAGHKQRTLWRGVHGLSLTEGFMDKGGTEFAPMSTSADEKSAVNFAHGGANPMLFKYDTKNSIDRGADIAFLSVYETEAEVLYPPLTYLRFKSMQKEQVAGTELLVVNVDIQITGN